MSEGARQVSNIRRISLTSTETLACRSGAKGSAIRAWGIRQHETEGIAGTLD